MHGTHLPLRSWFLAAYLLATHSNGMSALQLQPKLGLGSYKTAWLLLHKIRGAMVDPDRRPLRGMIEIDETTVPFRRKDEPEGGGALDEVRRHEKRWRYARRKPRRSALPPRRPGEERGTRRYVHPPSLAPEDIIRGYLRHVPIGSKITGARPKTFELR
ncbi:IS1595 family transposase [Rhizobium binae]|nr:IS1595 family transposase [Rhizobium binae]